MKRIEEMEEKLVKIRELETRIRALERRYLDAPEEDEEAIESEIDRLQDIRASINSRDVQKYRWQIAGCPDLDYGVPKGY